jgi:hypothetical protein
MEKEIKEDFTITWPIWCAPLGFMLFLLLVAGVMMFWQDQNWLDLAFMVGFAGASIWFVRFAFRTSVRRAAASPNRWLLTDDGLVRLYASGQREIIRWEQIRVMKWGRHVGLRIVWKEIERDHRSQEFRNEVKSQAGRCGGWLRVDEGQARQIFQRANRDWADMKL